MTPAVLSLHDVTIRYGSFLAVDSLNLEVRAGEIFGLLGPNGSGKSSTLSAVAGAVPLASGTVRVEGHCPYADPLAARRRLGLVPQDLAVYEDLTVEQNLRFFARLYGLTGPALQRRLADVLEFVRLTGFERRVVRPLSGGMQRRLNLACALLHEPRLLLLDEPTVGLDIQSRDAIFASLRRLRDQGCALVFTTHHLEEAEQLCNRLGVMSGGRIVATGSLAELCAELDPDGRRWRADGPHHHAPDRPRLERVYLELTGAPGPAGTEEEHGGRFDS